MPVVLVVIILILTFLVPQAERFVFQVVPTYFFAAEQQVERLTESADVVGTVRGITSGQYSLQDITSRVHFSKKPVYEYKIKVIDAEPPLPSRASLVAAAAFAVPFPVVEAATQRRAQTAPSYQVPALTPEPSETVRSAEEAQRGGMIGGMMEFFQDIWEFIVAVLLGLMPYSLILSTLLFIATMYSWMRFVAIRNAEWNKFLEAPYPDFMRPAGSQSAQAQAEVRRPAETRWQRILSQSLSQNPNDWRLAILDADIMLDDLLIAQGYKGDTLADKLKQVERADFRSIEMAWEAHKVRNKIAHEGMNHSIDEHEVRRVIGLYQQVFEEFKFV